MKRYLLAVLLSMFIDIDFVFADNLNEDDKVVIRDLIIKTLKNQNLVRSSSRNLNNKDILKNMPKHIIYENKRYTGKEYLKKLYTKSNSLKTDGIKTIKFSFKIKKINCLYLNNNSVNCYVKETIKATFVSKDNFLNKVKGEERLNIKFHLKKNINKKWSIDEQNIVDFEAIAF